MNPSKSLTKRSPPNHALGFDLGEGEGTICCSCYLHALEQSEMAELLAVTTEASKPIPGHKLCPKCNLPYLRQETTDAAKEITQRWLQ